MELVPVATTDRGAAADVVLHGAPAARIGGSDAVRRAECVATVLVCATLVGLGEAATLGAAGYIEQRQQFGRPLSSFQAPVLRLADARIDLDAMAVTMTKAAWVIDQGTDAREATSVAKWWAAEGGHRVVHTAQHLHGGIGADVSFPAHRYFLRAKQLVQTMGGAAVHAERLGELLASGELR